MHSKLFFGMLIVGFLVSSCKTTMPAREEFPTQPNGVLISGPYAGIGGFDKTDPATIYFIAISTNRLGSGVRVAVPEDGWKKPLFKGQSPSARSLRVIKGTDGQDKRVKFKINISRKTVKVEGDIIGEGMDVKMFKVRE